MASRRVAAVTVEDLTEPGGLRRGARSCPGCTAQAEGLFGYQSGFRWLRCNDCRTLYVADDVTAASLSAFYQSYYDDPLEVPPLAVERLRGVMDSFEKARSTGRFLDVGFGAGTLLSIAAERGWECWGAEMSPDQVEMGRARGWTVHEGPVTDWDLPAAYFDVVCMVEVIEHLPDPEAYLEVVSRILRPGGLFYCTTPNGNSLSARLLGTRWSVVSAPEHLQLFTAGGLERAARRHDLCAVKIRATGINPGELRSKGKADGRARVESAYELNQKVESRAAGRAVKTGVNAALSFTRLGDSLKALLRKSET